MFEESSEQAALYLRQAVPLMVKHQIPPTPYNYAIWYSYVSNRNPELKAAIDEVLRKHGTCPSSSGYELFQNHIIDSELADNRQVQDDLKGILGGLREQVDEALSGTADFHQVLERSSSTLNQKLSPVDLDDLIETLTQGTKDVSAVARQFKERIESAQREVEALKEALRQSQMEAERDPLTQLANRRSLERRMNQLIDEGCAADYCLIIADIDHFKSFNDTYGHLVGDKVIKRVAQLLDKSAGHGDMAVRFGGEEFVMLVRESSLEAAQGRAERLRRLVETIVLKSRKAGQDVRRITASFGVAAYRNGEVLADCIERADQALYQAKQQGRNRVVIGA